MPPFPCLRQPLPPASRRPSLAAADHLAVLLLLLFAASCGSSSKASLPPSPALPGLDEATLFLIPLAPGRSGLAAGDGSWLPLDATFRAECDGPFCQVAATIRSRDPVASAALVYQLPPQAAVTDLVFTCGRRKLRAIALPPAQIARVQAAARRAGLTCDRLRIDELQRLLFECHAEQAQPLQVDFRYVFAGQLRDGRVSWDLPELQGLLEPPRLKLAGAEARAGGLAFSAAPLPPQVWCDRRGRGLAWDGSRLRRCDLPAGAPALPAAAEALSSAVEMKLHPESPEACQEGLLLPETGAVWTAP